MELKEQCLKDVFYFYPLRHHFDVGSIARSKVRHAITELKKFRRISVYA